MLEYTLTSAIIHYGNGQLHHKEISTFLGSSCEHDLLVKEEKLPGIKMNAMHSIIKIKITNIYASWHISRIDRLFSSIGKFQH